MHMRKTVVFLTLLMLTLGLMAAGGDKGEPRFDSTTHNFGTIKEGGGPVTYEFEFFNVGRGNLLVVNAKAQCGCTRPAYPEAPVKPGKKGKIKVTYNPKGRPGSFSKTVTVTFANSTKGKVVLKIKGNVAK